MNPYAIGGGVIAALALICGLLFYRGEAIKGKAHAAEVQGQLNTALEVNKANAKTLKLLGEAQEANAKLAADLGVKVDKINTQAAQTNAGLADLRKSNAAVRAYLDGAVPDDVRRLLNNPSGGQGATHH